MFNLASVLTPFGFEPGIPTKLVRHQDQRVDVDFLYRESPRVLQRLFGLSQSEDLYAWIDVVNHLFT